MHLPARITGKLHGKVLPEYFLRPVYRSRDIPILSLVPQAVRQLPHGKVKRYFDFRTLPVGKTKSPVARCKNQRTTGLL
jgi:hypothetical protein